MPNFDPLSRYGLLAALFGAALLTTFAVPSDARAGDVDELVEYLPPNSQFAGRVDVDALRGTKYFDRAVDFIEERARKDESVPGVFDGSEAFDARSDLNGIAVGLPVSRVSPGQPVRRAVVAIDADFDRDEFEKLLEDQYPDLSTSELDGDTTVYEADDRAFVIPESNRLIAVAGPSSYKKQVWKLLQGEGGSFADVAEQQGLLAGVDTDRMIWMINRISRTGSDAKTAAVGIQLESGVDFQIVVRTNSESNAKSMTKRAEAMKKSGSESTMMRMLGAGPLLQNLEVNRDGSTVSATTSMTDSEFDYLVERIRQVTESGSANSLMREASDDNEASEPESGSEDQSTEESDESDDSQ